MTRETSDLEEMMFQHSSRAIGASTAYENHLNGGKPVTPSVRIREMSMWTIYVAVVEKISTFFASVNNERGEDDRQSNTHKYALHEV